MLDRVSFNNEDYAQDGDYCVLASYAVALRRLIQTPPSVHDFFEGYCREMKLTCETPAFVRAIHIERLYLADFTAKTKFAGISGYELLLALHVYSEVTPFRQARDSTGVEHLRLPRDLRTVEAALRGADRTMAIVFVNHVVPVSVGGIIHDIAQNHSVTIGCDNRGFYMYDVNRRDLDPNQKTLDLGQSLQFLGYAECLVFSATGGH